MMSAVTNFMCSGSNSVCSCKTAASRTASTTTWASTSRNISAMRPRNRAINVSIIAK